MTFARVVAETGLTKVELAALYGVSRQAIWEWGNGGEPREGSILARMATVITSALLTAVKTRKLPLGAMDKTTRRRVIANLATSLQNLKPAPIK